MRPCPSCSRHVLAADPSCPHCGAGIGLGGPTLAAAVLALSLTGCVFKASTPEADYGVATTYSHETDTDTDSDTDADVDSDTDADSDSDSASTGDTAA